MPIALAFVTACSGGASHDAASRGGTGASAGTGGLVVGGGLGGSDATPGNSLDSGVTGGSRDNALIVPEGLAVSAHLGNNSVFSVSALTLQMTPSGARLYAAVRNDGDTPGCNVAFSVLLYDDHEQTVGAGVGGLMTASFFRRADGSIAGCVVPGDLTMVAISSLDLDPTPLEAVRSVVYSSQYWSLPDAVPIPGVSLRRVEPVSRDGRVAYTGALLNELEQPITDPTVAVYPFNSVGRPLGVAYGRAMLDLAPGRSWEFETEAVSEVGVGFAAFPMGGS